MDFKYRIKTYKDEEGEYSEYQPTDKETILKLIETDWLNEPSSNGLHVISICNNRGENLLLEHFNKHVFDVYFLPIESNFHFHKKSTIEIVLSSLELFFDDEIYGIEESLNSTKKDNDYIRGEFFFIDFDYKYSNSRSVKEGLWLLYGLVYGIMFLSMGILVFLTDKIVLFNLFGVIFFLFGFYLWLPGLLLHFQYKKDISNWTIRVTRGQDKIIATSPKRKKEFDKKDIIKVIQHKNPAYKIPWSEYGYVQIEFNTGEIINLTSLVANQLFFMDKFSDDIRKFKVDESIPWITRKTKID